MKKNISLTAVIKLTWRPVLVVEEAGVPGENHRPLVIGLYELLGNPTT
jgi:hypothetical protein